MKALPIALLVLTLGSSAALAQSVDPPPANQSAPVPAADDDEEIVVEGEIPKEKRKICTMRTETGSIMPKRVCRTVAQIEEEQRVARESLEIIKRDHDSRGYVELSRSNR